MTNLASEHYLLPATNLGDAILHITATKDCSHFIAEVYEKSNTSADLIPPHSHEAFSFIEKRFKHGCRKLSRKGILHPIYEIPITDYSIQLIKKAWTNPKIISEMAQPLFNSIFLREFKAEQNAKRTAQWRADGTIPTAPWFDNHDQLLLALGITLNPYQKVASFNACYSRGYGFLAKPGLGKTAMMIRKFDHVLDNSQRQTMTLILCPKTIRQNWINELQKFSSNTANIHVCQLVGLNATDRVCNFIDECTKADGKHIVLISGYEAFINTDKLHAIEFDQCFLDESQNIANPSTKRTKVLLEVRNQFHNRIIATGSPFRNTPFDMWTQFEFLGDGYSGFDTFAAHKEFFGAYSIDFQGKSHLEGFKNIPLMQERLAKYTFIIDKEEALPHLPKKTFSISECNLSKDQYKVYMALSEELYAEIESYGPDPDSITVNNVLTKMLRLAQITSGFAKTDESGISSFDPNPKLDLLVSYLLGDEDEETEGVLQDKNRKAIVWCCFKENLKMIHSRLKLEGIDSVMFHGSTEDKDDVVQIFNCDPQTRVFIGIAASGGVGLNLVGFDPYKPEAYSTNTTDTIIYSSNWSMVNRMQAIDRAHRHITRVPQHIKDLLVPGSIDMDIYNRLNSKNEMSVGLQDIKQILRHMIPQVNGN